MDDFSPTESQEVTRPEAERALDRANAQMTSMRASLSMLTASSAQLATALEKRNQEYDALVLRQGEVMHQLEAIRTELHLATAEGANLKEQVNERNAQLVDLHGQLAGLRCEVESVTASKTALETQLGEVEADLAGRVAAIEGLNARLADLQTQLGSAVAAKADVETKLEASTTELDDLQKQLAALQDEITAAMPVEVAVPEAAAERAVVEVPVTAVEEAVPSEVTPEAVPPEVTPEAVPPEVTPEAVPPAAALEEAVAPETVAEMAMAGTPEIRPAAKAAALTAAVTSLVERTRQQDAALQEAAAQVASLNEQINALTAEKASLEAGLQEKEQTLTDLNLQIEGLNGTLAELQLQLASALTAHREAAEKLQADEAELDDLEQKLAAWQSDLQAVLPAEAAWEAVSAEVAAEEGVPVEAAPEAVSAEIAAEEGAPAEAAPEAGESIAAAPEEGEPAQAAAPEVAAEEPAAETPVVRRAAKASALTAAVAAVVSSARQKDADLSALNERLDAAAAEKTSLEGVLQEKEESIGGLNDRIERLTGSLNFVQAQLDGTLLGKGEVENKLRASEAELEDLDRQLAAVQDQLAAVAPAEAADEAVPAEAVPEAAGAPRVAKAGAVAAGVAALLAASRQKDTALQDAESQIASANEHVNVLTTEKAGLEASLQEKEQAISDLKAEIDALNTGKAGLEASLQEKMQALTDLKAHFEALHVKVAGLNARLGAVVPFQEAASMAAALADLPATKQGAAAAAIIAGVQPHLTERLQGLSGIRGIGRALRGRLYNAGIGTYWEVAALPDDEMRRVLALSGVQLERIKLDDVRADAYSRARETDSVGYIWRGHSVDDFEPFSGIGAVFEERLYEAGIYTYEQLAGATVEQLAEICRAPEMNMPDYADWIAQARKAVEDRQDEASSAEPVEKGEGEAQPAEPAEEGESEAQNAQS